MSEPILSIEGVDAFYGAARILQGVTFEMESLPTRRGNGRAARRVASKSTLNGRSGGEV